MVARDTFNCLPNSSNHWQIACNLTGVNKEKKKTLNLPKEMRFQLWKAIIGYSVFGEGLQHVQSPSKQKQQDSSQQLLCVISYWASSRETITWGARVTGELSHVIVKELWGKLRHMPMKCLTNNMLVKSTQVCLNFFSCNEASYVDNKEKHDPKEWEIFKCYQSSGEGESLGMKQHW